MEREKKREKTEGCEHLHSTRLDRIAVIFNLCCRLTWTVIWRNFESLVGVKVINFDGQGKVRDSLLGVVSFVCRDKGDRVFLWQFRDNCHRKLVWLQALILYLAALCSLCCQLCSPGATGNLASNHLWRTECRCCPPCLPGSWWQCSVEDIRSYLEKLEGNECL